MTYKIDISHKTIFFITGFLLSLWLIYLIKDILLLLFVAFIFVSALSPAVNRLEKFKIPRVLAILTIFLLVFGTIGSLITLGITPLINETRSLFQTLIDIVATVLRENYIDESIIRNELSNASRDIIGFTLSFFENLIGLASVIVITFYLLLDQHKIEDLAVSIFYKRQERARKLISRLEDKLGAWVRGQLVLSIIVGVAVYLGLTALGVPFAFPLAILSGLLEVIPIIGPIISAIPGVLLALTVSPVLAGIVAALYLAIQQLEGHIIVPQVMKRAVGLNPILVILAIAIGGRLLGLGGALLSVPIAVCIQVVLQDVLEIGQELEFHS